MNVTKENIKRTMQVLIDNGIAATVLQAIGYTLIDTELEDLIDEVGGWNY